MAEKKQIVSFNSDGSLAEKQIVSYLNDGSSTKPADHCFAEDETRIKEMYRQCNKSEATCMFDETLRIAFNTIEENRCLEMVLNEELEKNKLLEIEDSKKEEIQKNLSIVYRYGKSDRSLPERIEIDKRVKEKMQELRRQLKKKL